MRRAILLAVGGFLAAEACRAGDPAVQFYRDVRPILSNHCLACHGPDENARQAGLRLDTREGLFGAADSGAQAVVPGDRAASELFRRISSDDPAQRMPTGPTFARRGPNCPAFRMKPGAPGQSIAWCWPD
jgi:hypothetical protein